MSNSPSINATQQDTKGGFSKKLRFRSKTIKEENSTPVSWTTEDSNEDMKSFIPINKKSKFASEENPKIFQILSSNKTEVILFFI
jgi:hypothetical protein